MAFIIRVRRIGELGTTLAITSNRSTLRTVIANVVPISPILVSVVMEAPHSSKTSVHTRGTLRHIPEGGGIHSAVEFAFCHKDRERLQRFVTSGLWDCAGWQQRAAARHHARNIHTNLQSNVLIRAMEDEPVGIRQ
jgi:hypothetical protein